MGALQTRGVEVGDAVAIAISDPDRAEIAAAAARCAGATITKTTPASVLITDTVSATTDGVVVIDIRSHLWSAELLAMGDGQCMCGEHD